MLNRMDSPEESGKFIKCVNNNSHGFLLDKEGRVWVFGENSQGQLGLNHSEPLSTGLQQNPFLRGIKDMASKGE